MASPRKLELLNLAVSLIPSDGSERYLEVGTYQGKSLIAAMRGNPGRKGIACDNFSEFNDPRAGGGNSEILRRNLRRYRLESQVDVFDEDFVSLFRRSKKDRLFPPIGVYFYDGAHDELSQYNGIREAEALLADEALVIVDDWRFASDSGSKAEVGTRRAISESHNEWNIPWILPARYNGDNALWWNGVAVLTFRRAQGVRTRASAMAT